MSTKPIKSNTVTIADDRVPCPRCGQKNLLVERRSDGKWYRGTHGFDPSGDVLCRGTKKPLTGHYNPVEQ